METNNPELQDEETSDLARSEPPTGRILIKLKLPKMAAEDGGELRRHYCPECNRSFSSGKALGGHMSSAHVQASKDQSLRKMKSKTKTNHRTPGGASGEGIAEIVCAECGKNFTSMKALFGHMRCHPERTYRGMMNSTIRLKVGPQIGSGNPNFAKFGEESEASDGTDGPDRMLKSWSRTGKRGRPQLIKSPPSSAAASTEEEEVFDALIMLHRGDFGASQTNQKQESDDRRQKKIRVSKEEEEEEGIDECDMYGKKSKEPLTIVTEGLSGIEKSDDGICLSAMVELMKGARMEGLDLSMRNPNLGEGVSPVKYVCNVCGKSFTTHQALGGHRLSHRKFKMSIVNMVDNECGSSNIVGKMVAGKLEDQSLEDGNKDNDDGKSHVCKVCNESFGSGQTLGGHMRSHLIGEDDEHCQKSITRIKYQQEAVVMDFDLNEMPHNKDDN